MAYETYDTNYARSMHTS